MTNRIIVNNIRKIDLAKEQGFYLEALLRAYHVNVSLLKYILEQGSEKTTSENHKPGNLLKSLVKARKKNPGLKSLIGSQSLKSVRIWLDKSDKYFKTLKIRQPYNTKRLLDESTRICSMLNVSVSKASLGARS